MAAGRHLQSPPLEQFRALGSVIDKMADANDRVAAAHAFFGRSDASLLSMFSAKGFGDAAKQSGTQAQILGRDAALFDDASDKLALAGTKLTGFFIGVADRVVPVLKPLIDSFAVTSWRCHCDGGYPTCRRQVWQSSREA